MLPLILFCLFSLVFGCIFLFQKDTVWQWQNNNNRRRGLKSERTPEWELSTTMSGYMMIFVGIAMLGFSLYASNANRPMSGNYLDGRQLTVEEAKEFNKDPSAFFLKESFRDQAR